MNSAVCTLFEGSYHYGVAALANSLHASGFRGRVYAGHRGDLPAWARGARPCPLEAWPEATELGVGDGLTIVFLALQTTHHLTNHKPEFMLALLDGPACRDEALFYFDPDICVTSPWRFFEDWVSCGVALCEDVNSPLPKHHPRRVGWRRYYASRGMTLRFRLPQYVNGGFVGARHVDRPFLETWKRAMDLMASEIGSLATASIARGQSYRSTGFANCFDCTDQDALNVAIEAAETTPSVVGQEAMGFKAGSALLPHALGSAKPWQRSYLRFALRGISPRLADKAFWTSASGPLRPYRDTHVALKRLEIAFGAALCRFMRRA